MRATNRGIENCNGNLLIRRIVMAIFKPWKIAMAGIQKALFVYPDSYVKPKKPSKIKGEGVGRDGKHEK